MIRIRDIKPNRTVTRYAGEYDRAFIVTNGDLLVGMDGEFNSVIWNGGEALLNQRVCKLHSFKNCLKEYVAWLIPKKLKEIEDSTYAVTVKHISAEQIRKIEIPLPSLEVQKEIVAEIEGYQKVIDGARAVLDNYCPHIPVHPEWALEKFGEVISTITPPAKIQAGNFSDEGRFPVIDQSQNAIAGRTNDEAALVDGTGGLVIFGDHTCAVKFVNERFAQGADGIKIIKAGRRLEPKFIYFYLLSHPIAQEGYKRHFGKLKETPIAVPPVAIQQQIIAEIEAEQALVAANRELISRFEKKIQATLARVWAEEEPVTLEP